MSRPGVLWSVLALAVAIIVLAATFIVLRAPSAVPRVARNSVGGSVTIGASCTHYPGAEVTVGVPDTSGVIVVSATVGVGLNHTFGLADASRIVVAASSTDCALDNYSAWASVPTAQPSDSAYYETLPLLRTFRVTAAGTYTFYVNGIAVQGSDPGDRFDSASLVATFYPS